MKNNRIIAILMVLTIVFTIMGGSLAYWTWDSEVRSNLAFTLSKDFSCSADGGKDLNSDTIQLVPTTCDNANNRVIKREIKVTPTIKKSGLSINLNMWLKVDTIDKELSNSQNLRYVLTTSGDSCTTGVVSEGNFSGSNSGSRVSLLNSKQYNYGFVAPDTYYLWIWLDKEESNNNTMDKSFKLSLGGECTDSPKVQSEEPALDNGMIPVKIANDGKVTTVREGDSSWYDYNSKQWANVVLVNNSSRSKYQNTSNVEVNQNDILAYYVWIPRYKYKISTVTCDSISDEITKTSNPECYDKPYSVSDSDREKLYNYFYNYLSGLEKLEAGCDGCRDCVETGYGSFVMCDGCGAWSCNDSTWTTFVPEKAEISVGYLLGEITDFEIRNNLQMDYGSFDYIKDIDYYVDLLGIAYKSLNSYRIDIEFENGTEKIAKGDAKNTYYTHPAFWWDSDGDKVQDSSEMLSGIWVGKFETTGSASSPRVLPNVKPLTNQNIGNQFWTSHVFSSEGNSYGLSYTNTNSHMMTNSEWGAVAYLASSRYGKHGQVMLNGYSLRETGCGSVVYYDDECSVGINLGCGGVATGDECVNQYGKSEKYPQSTTGNITGVFDMSGGVYEYVMGNYGENEASGETTRDMFFLKGSYINIYLNSSYSLCTLETCGGHALYETAGWYGDAQGNLTQSYPWYVRGGNYEQSDADEVISGIFAFNQAGGGATLDRGFRMTIINGVHSFDYENEKNWGS